jgi:enterobactin synthetase component D
MFSLVPNPKILLTPYHFSVAWGGEPDHPMVPGRAALPDALRTASPKRKTEFLAGRFCAAKALGALNPNLTMQVGIHHDGSPRWPHGIVGSITHTDGFASAAVAGEQTCLSLGIDSESLLSAESLEAARTIAIRDDARRLLQAGFLCEDHITLLIFSAKESVYKCLHPLVQRPNDTAAIRLTAIDPQGGTFDFILTESLSLQFPPSFGGRGRFEFSQGCVHTAVELRKNPVQSTV